VSYIDIICAVLIIWGLYKGFAKGLIIQLASITALLLGIYIGVKFSHFASDHIAENFAINSKYLPIISFSVTFILVVIAVHLLGRMIEKFLGFVALGFFNKLFGALFGAAKTALILSVFILVVDQIDRQIDIIPDSEKKKSVLFQPLANLLPAIIPEFEEMIEEKQEETIS